MTRTKATATKPAADAEPTEVTSWSQLGAILATDERPVERVVVREWPGAPVFYLRGLTGHDRDAIENTTFGEGVNDISAKIVARSLCKPDGTPLVPRGNMAEAEKMLTARTAGGLLRLQRVARRLSGMDNAAVDELEAMLSKEASG